MLTMLFTAATVTATAAKWLVVGKILTVAGAGVLTVAPVIEEMKKSDD